MKEAFGILPDGRAAFLYTISGGGLTAAVTDYGAALVRLLVPDAAGKDFGGCTSAEHCPFPGRIQ